ncbi:FliH/SctL family protein [Roseisalinus antarcticus]|uniref:Flagellar assembly protein H n=1 Tax=Roseisalinus antarcticus TaxID=254357 RepID=A0A1Y5U1T1_9RHOB|nr:hypothetical protein [Roseisalinus antarcticus]SLN76548.1 flagellar assembly protein H [Roseisalinus antarcticus]
MGRTPFLESFDVREQSTPVEAVEIPEPELGYEDGFRTGLEAGRAEAMAEQAQLSAEIAQSFTELTFTHSEARTELLQALRPLFTAVTEILLPKAAQASLAPYIAETLVEAAEADTKSSISLLVAPGSVEAVREIAERQAGSAVVVQSDEDLGHGEVLIRGAKRETMLDLDRLVSELGQALAGLFVEDTRRARHG